MKSRSFQLDTEWNMIHYPERPNGFGILVIGDERHFVDEKSSFWTQNEGKAEFVDSLRNAGYTIFYSNLYGKNWGSEEAVKLAHRLYNYIIRNEILNEKIHIIAEGMGALVALKLVKQIETKIRSIILINPILSLSQHLEQEKEHKFFYKKLLKEISLSYKVEIKKVEEGALEEDWSTVMNPNVPVKIIHILSGNRAYKQSAFLNILSVKWEEEEMPISICYMLPEKKQQLGRQVTQFFKSKEKIL